MRVGMHLRPCQYAEPSGCTTRTTSRPRWVSNPQSSDPKSDALSITLRGRIILSWTALRITQNQPTTHTPPHRYSPLLPPTPTLQSHTPRPVPHPLISISRPTQLEVPYFRPCRTTPSQSTATPLTGRPHRPAALCRRMWTPGVPYDVHHRIDRVALAYSATHNPLGVGACMGHTLTSEPAFLTSFGRLSCRCDQIARVRRWFMLWASAAYPSLHRDQNVSQW